MVCMHSNTPAAFTAGSRAPISANEPSQPTQVQPIASVLATAASRSRNSARGVIWLAEVIHGALPSRWIAGFNTP